MSKNENEIISEIKPHTEKKFRLVEKYVEAWVQKLLNNKYCNKITFIDCMCNSGEYIDVNGNQIFGTPVRVAKILRDAAGQYPDKKVYLILNDRSPEKIEHLKSLIKTDNKPNYSVTFFAEDANDLLKRIGNRLPDVKDMHSLLFYDPYKAEIDWKAIEPFLNNWGEVIINHSTMDSTRAIKMAKSEKAIKKYEQTYCSPIEKLIPYGSDRIAYEKRVEEIIQDLHRNKNRRYFVAAFPFFNSRNVVMYNLIHCTGNIEGFKLYKKTAWQTFGGKSSTKDTHGEENQLEFGFDYAGGELKRHVDESCYYVKDIADFLQDTFRGQKDVPISNVWGVLDLHPVFPSDGFKNQIKEELKTAHNAEINRSSISFAEGS